MDVKSTFLNGDLQEEFYVEQPVCFIVTSKEHKVLKIKKALYGLHQAPRPVERQRATGGWGKLV
jgi:hypothetical protein